MGAVFFKKKGGAALLVAARGAAPARPRALS